MMRAISSAGTPAAVTLDKIVFHTAEQEARGWFKDRRSARQIPRRMEAAGYVPVRNPYAKDGLWKVAGSRVAIYGRVTLSSAERLAAAAEIVRHGRDHAGK
jgi:hypothetical protein